jgi:peptide chain release factor 2
MEGADFWNDPAKAQSLIAELKKLKALFGPLSEYGQQAKDLGEFIELYEADGDPASAQQLLPDVAKLAAHVERFELKAQLSGKNDHRNVYLSIHAGACAGASTKASKPP